jgi:hypothetical protein
VTVKVAALARVKRRKEERRERRAEEAIFGLCFV